MLDIILPSWPVLQNIPTSSLWRGKTLPSVVDMTQNNLIVNFSNARALGNMEYTFIAITPRSTQASEWLHQKELFDI